MVNGVPMNASMVQAAFRSGFAVVCQQCDANTVVTADNQILQYVPHGATVNRRRLDHPERERLLAKARNQLGVDF